MTTTTNNKNEGFSLDLAKKTDNLRKTTTTLTTKTTATTKTSIGKIADKMAQQMRRVAHRGMAHKTGKTPKTTPNTKISQILPLLKNDNSQTSECKHCKILLVGELEKCKEQKKKAI